MIGRGWRLIRVAAQTDVWNATRLQAIPQRRIVPAEHVIVWWKRHDDGIDFVEPALRPAAQRVDGCARANRVRSILVGERGHRVIVEAHVLSRRTASPWAGFGDNDGAVRFDGLVQ